MEQTLPHEQHNPELLSLMPANARVVVEVGCSSGALAREYKKINANCRYVGIELVCEYVPLAQRHCDTVLAADIELLEESYLRESLAGDCWVFGDTLEHLNDPWEVLAKIRRVIPSDGSVVACIPNAQHWSVQARLNGGNFHYEKQGLLDKSHLRWFTRTTLFEMFQNARFRIVEGLTRTFNEPLKDKVIPAIKLMASSMGADPEVAARDALPFQYVVRAVPT